MKRLFFLLLFSCLMSFAVITQAQYETREAIDLFNSTKMARGELKTLLTEKDIEGSPYLNDDFIEGTVFTTIKTKYTGVPLRYNIYSDQIEFKAGEGAVQELAAPETVEKVEFGEYKMVYIPFAVSKKIRRGFFREMESGDKAVLLTRQQVLFEDAKKPAAYQEAEPPRFIRKPDDYYIRIGKEPARLISRKKDLEEAFPGHKKEINSFIKENKVKPNKPERLAELVQYYNSL
ncbi:MAG: hypothetical protein ACOCWK_05515 [Tangfeifania sp.]